MQAHKYAPCSQAECTETHVAASARTCLMASFMPKTAKQHHAAKVGCRRALALGMASRLVSQDHLVYALSDSFHAGWQEEGLV